MANPSKALSGRSNPGWWPRVRLAAVLLPGLAAGLALGCGAGIGTGPNNSNPPNITSFTPTFGSYAASTSVVVTGSGFSTGVTGAAVGGVPVTTAGTVAGDTQVTFQVPAAAITGVISVTTKGGTGSSGSLFVVTPTFVAPIVPTSGPINTPVTVNGYGLTGIASITIVGPGLNPTPIPVAIVSQSANQIILDIPASAAAGANTIVLALNPIDGTAPIDIPFTVTPQG